MSMANGTDSKEFAASSKARTGLKRELAFALKVQAEMCESLGRTRARRAQNEAIDNPSGKRLKVFEKLEPQEFEAEIDLNTSDDCYDEKERVVNDVRESISEDDEKSDVVDVVSEDEPKSNACQSAEKACEEELKGGGVVDIANEDESKSGGVVNLVKIENIKDGLAEALVDEMFKVEKANNVESERPPIDETKELITPQEEVRVNQIEDGLLEAVKADEPKVEEVKIIRPERPSVDEMMTLITPKEEAGCSVPGKHLADEMESIPGVCVDKVEELVMEEPLRRFTRSAFKPKPEMVDKPANQVKGENEDSNVGSSLASPPKILEMRTPKKRLKKFPGKLKDLLMTGVLEGEPVRYIRGSKARVVGESGLRGVIRGSGVVCYCGSCKGIVVVSPAVYELHALSSNKRPPEYIYLENGQTLRDVMNVCQNSTLDTLEESIRSIIGCRKSTICFNCKGPITKADVEKAVLLCNSCQELKESQPKFVEIAKEIDESPKSALVPMCSDSVSKHDSSLGKICGRLTRKSPKSTLVPRCFDSVSKHNSSLGKSCGRLTRKDLRLHKLVFEEDVLPDGTEVAYYSHGEKLLVGYKKGYGIFCSCCNSEVSPSQFEAHAGYAARRKPYLHIYTSNGVSLHELSLSLSRDRKFSSIENDDLCTVCRNGGDLVCCDGCPRAYHKDCINLNILPTGTWYCKYCQNLFNQEKSVERNSNAVAAGRIPGIDPIEQITNRCIRIVNSDEIDFGGCALCKSHDFSTDFGPLTVLYCDQCEREFHVGCLKDHGMQELKELPKGMWFCCSDCHRINSALQKLVIRGEQVLPEPLLNVIREKNKEDSEGGAELDVKWRILNGKMANDETKLLLSKAKTIFNDCFAPIVDSATHCDFITTMLYGDSIKGQDFSRIYCALLIVNQSVVSAGLFRIYGSDVAELPLVATNAQFQGQGYFQTLFSCLERLLAFLNVKSLVLPAADEAESIWTNKFGFQKLAQEEVQKALPNYDIPRDVSVVQIGA